MGGSGATGAATGAGTRHDVTLKLSQLQNLCKRDPDGYREEYDAQMRKLESECAILALQSHTSTGIELGGGGGGGSQHNASGSHRLVESIQFAAAVSSSCYKGVESDRIASLLVGMLVGEQEEQAQPQQDGGGSGGGGGKKKNKKKKGNSPAAATPISFDASSPTPALHLHRDVRKAVVSALILMRNKGAVPPLRLLQLFFQLMVIVPDKNLREVLYRHVVNDVRNINKKGKRDENVNRNVQAFLHRVVSSTPQQQQQQSLGSDDASADVTAAKRAVDMTVELYRRNVWTDERTVSILATAACHPNGTVMAKALRFFLGIEEKMAEDKAREEDDEWAGVNEVDLHLHSKKTKARQRQVGKQIKNRRKKQAARERDEQLAAEGSKSVEASKKLYPAIELLHDPQGLAESVFRKMRGNSTTCKFELKLLMINFVTRLVGNHELLLLPLYPFLQRYMGGGHQRDVTAVLAYAVQACHRYVPPEEVHGILKTIAHNFITERCTGEQMAVGINAVRAICARVPSVLSNDNDDDGDEVGGGGGSGGSSGRSTTFDVEAFVRDLAAYSKHRDRSVSIAGRGWTNFVREVHPSLLQGKDRGSIGSALHRAGEKPLRYGEAKAPSGVAGADLLAEYESKKAAKRRVRRGREGEESGSDESDDDDDGIREERMNDESEEESDEGSGEWIDVDDEENDSDNGSGEWVDVDDDGENDKDKDVTAGVDDGDGEEAGQDEADSDDDGDVAPNLVLAKEVDGKMVPATSIRDGKDDQGDGIDLSKMSAAEREKLQQQVSSTRVFTASDFEKMRKLVARQEKAKRDPRAAARLKRAMAKGEDFEALSEDDSDSDSDDEGIHIAGAVNPTDIMAEAKKKRASKAEKLEQIIAGRQKFEAKEREGGSTNTEKKRKKNFVMTKFSYDARKKRGLKETARGARKHGSGRDSKKRRRKI